MKDFKNNTLRGFKWSFLNKGFFLVIKTIYTIIIARLLSPEEFGIFAMITVFATFGSLFKDIGFGHALIFRKDNSIEEYNSIFWINILTGIGLSLIFYFGAPLIANFYEKNILILYTQVLSVIFIIQAFGIVGFTELEKKLNFKNIAIIENISFLFSSILAITLAYFGFGVWSLVWKIIIELLVKTILVYIKSEFKPFLSKNIFNVKSMLNYSISVSANRFITYWLRNIDNLMIGKLLNQNILGAYNIAYQIMLAPIQNISIVIIQVLFPAFSSINNDVNKIRSIYLNVVQTVALITFPLLCSIFGTTELFVNVILGEKWKDVTPILTILSLLAIPQSIFSINGTIYLSTGKPHIPMIINTISFPLYTLGFYLGLRLNGIMGLVYAYVIIFTIMIIPMYYFSAKQIHLSLKSFIKTLSPIIFSTLILLLSTLIAKNILFANLSNVISLILTYITAIVTYSISIILMRKKIALYFLLLEKRKSYSKKN